MAEIVKPIKNFAASAIRFVARYVEIAEKTNTSKDYIFYGNDNVLPNKLIRYVNESGTAKKCTAEISDFIEADGFVNEATQLFQFNKEQKGDGFLSDIAMQWPLFKGFALLIKRNAKGEVGESVVLPFQKIRKSKKGGFWFNQNVGNKALYKDSEWVWYPEFKGVKVDINFLKNNRNGEIFYAFKKTAESPFYPVPDYYAGIEDIVTSAELSKLDLELVWNGFMTSAIITFIGDPNQTIENENGETVKEMYENQLKEFTGGYKNQDGMSGRMSAFINWVASKDEAPILQTFDPKSIIDASNTKRDAINRDVCRLFGVHPVLIGFSDAAILGNQQALSNAQKQLINKVNPIQRFISDSLKKVYPNMDFAISQVQPLAVADPQLLASLTEDEKRNLFWGLEPDKDIPTEGKKILTMLEKLSPALQAKVLDAITPDVLIKAFGIKSETPIVLPLETSSNGQSN